MKNKRILVTGGAGSIGSELVRQLAPGNTVYIHDINETAMFDLVEELRLKGHNVIGRLGDVKEKDNLMSVFLEFMPHIVFNCAALKHVTPSMWTPREYVRTNVLGTLNQLELAREYGTPKFINVSTDKAVDADNIMGWTKRGTEMLTRIYGGISVRFGNVMGSRGSVIPIWQKQLEDGEPLTVTDEKMERYMMTIPEACELIIEAAKGEPGDIYIMDMGKRVNVLGLATDILKKSGTTTDIKIIGKRPGEALVETLMSEKEKQLAIKKGKFYVLKEKKEGRTEESESPDGRTVVKEKTE